MSADLSKWQDQGGYGPGSTVPASRTLADPPIGAYNITAAMISDTVDLATPIRGFETNATGDVKVMCADGSIVTFLNRLAGSRTSCLIKRIYATGTAAAQQVVTGGITPLIGLV